MHSSATSWSEAAWKRIGRRNGGRTVGDSVVDPEKRLRARQACRTHLRDQPGTAYADEDEMRRLVDRHWRSFLDRIEIPPIALG